VNSRLSGDARSGVVSDGTVEAMYIQLLDEPVARTEEIQEQAMLADYTA
jgi:hypothetical protein